MHDGISEPQIHAPVCSITLHSLVTMCRAASEGRMGRELPLPGLLCV